MEESDVMEVLAMLLAGAVMVLITLYCVISGVAAMNGTWRGWAAKRNMYQFGKHSYFGFLGFYLLPFIAVGSILTVCPALGLEWFDGVNTTYVLAPFMLLALACLFRLPRFMLPAWYKDWVDRGADKEEVRKPEYSSPFTWLRKSGNVRR
ncbi:MAG: hypothetical protein ABS910_08855 [Arthrobacter sp.]